jgi:hypothetical protein
MRSACFALLFGYLWHFALALAQDLGPISLRIGSDVDEIGLVSAPNEECRGPATVAAATDGRLAILDKVNQKIILVREGRIESIPLPSSLVEAADLLVTTAGYVIVGSLGEVVVLSLQGALITRTMALRDPDLGSVRLVFLEDNAVALEELDGDKIPIDISTAVIGRPIISGTTSATGYLLTRSSINTVSLENDAVPPPLSKLELSSTIRISDARAIWAEQGEGALVALHEIQTFPEEEAFVRLVSFNADGQPIEETYLGRQAFSCDIHRPFARLSDGTVVSLTFSGGNDIIIERVVFAPYGSAEPKPLGARPNAALISDEGENVLRELERLNGTPEAGPISLSPISPESILERARAALGIMWQMRPENFSHFGLASRCSPVATIWRRPPRLDGLLNLTAEAVPYKWGGYQSSLERFASNLANGQLAGDDCTCRSANCVEHRATGMDCSGFVSYAWQLGNYYTTASLPKPEVSDAISWGDIVPGDIVNKAGSHVRLVESIRDSAKGRILTVIESAANEACGGVCRREYLEADLRSRNYKPLRRRNLIN